MLLIGYLHLNLSCRETVNIYLDVCQTFLCNVNCLFTADISPLSFVDECHIYFAALESAIELVASLAALVVQAALVILVVAELPLTSHGYSVVDQLQILHPLLLRNHSHHQDLSPADPLHNHHQCSLNRVDNVSLHLWITV